MTTQSDIEILHEDDGLLAVNKPAGLLAVPDRFDKAKANLFDLLRANRVGQYLGNVHRLDRHTSGVMIFAKTSDAYRQLTAQFRERQTRKVYATIYQGRPADQVIDRPIGERPDRPGYSRIDEKNGKPARSRVRVREEFRGYAWLEVEIETGRPHQIRVHLQAIGHPLMGDADYGGAPLRLSDLKPGYKPKPGVEERPLLARPALHAAAVTLVQPALTIRAPLPKDIEVALRYLRRFSAVG